MSANSSRVSSQGFKHKQPSILIGGKAAYLQPSLLAWVEAFLEALR